MLSRAELYECVFKRYAKHDKTYRDDLIGGPGLPSDGDWKMVRCMIEFLKKFYHLTLKEVGACIAQVIYSSVN